MSDDVVVIGAIAAPWGIKGWLKLLSFTEPRDNLSDYRSCLCNRGDGWQEVTFDTIKPQGKSMVGYIAGVDDRDAALEWRGAELGIPKKDLPPLEADEFYWHQLVGLTVVSEYDGADHLLGDVAQMMATGANDVLVIRPTAASIDQKERLVPWAPGSYVVGVDAEKGEIRVRWDPEF